MAADLELEALDARAWKTMAYALQRSVLEQFRMIEELRQEIAMLHKIARHTALRAEQQERDLREFMLLHKRIPEDVAFNGDQLRWQEQVLNDQRLHQIYTGEFLKETERLKKLAPKAFGSQALVVQAVNQAAQHVTGDPFEDEDDTAS